MIVRRQSAIVRYHECFGNLPDTDRQELTRATLGYMNQFDPKVTRHLSRAIGDTAPP